MSTSAWLRQTKKARGDGRTEMLTKSGLGESSKLTQKTFA